jgi:hypothetical protein
VNGGAENKQDRELPVENLFLFLPSLFVWLMVSKWDTLATYIGDDPPIKK